jgi:sec-independent protein translocase protein TatC
MSEPNGGTQPPDSEQPMRFPPAEDPEHGLDPQIEPARPPALTPKYTPPPAVGEEDDEDQGMLRMSFLEHLEELRSRIIKVLIGGGVAFAISMVAAIPLWRIVQAPLQYAINEVHGEIIAITPMEQFTIIWMWSPLMAAIYIAAPWVLYQIWAFIAPGLYPRERKWAAPFIIITAGLFLAGGAFAYFVAFRLGLAFLLGLGANTGVKATITIDSYFSLFVNVILGVSLLFLMPVVVFFLTLLRITTPGFLMRNSRYAILAIVILAAVVTPTPDPVNLAIFAVPMILLFFLGVFASYLLVLHREQQKFPWKAFFIWIGAIVFLVGATTAIAVLQYGYKVVPNWPFLVH